MVNDCENLFSVVNTCIGDFSIIVGAARSQRHPLSSTSRIYGSLPEVWPIRPGVVNECIGLWVLKKSVQF